MLHSLASEGDSWCVRDGTREERVRVRGALVANNGDALTEAAVAGMGVTVQPTFIASDALRDGRLVRVLPGWELPGLDVHGVFPSARHLPSKVRGFVYFLTARFRNSPWDAGLG